MVDKNLFLHDLAIVAILKNEAPYLKEWLDYHLLAGVDHFYLYDNESPDNQAEIAKPYVEAGLVDYFHAPGKVMQKAVYIDAVKRFKFLCRYMALIDGDEFILPKTGGGISKTVDEILSHDLNAAGLAIHWQEFGSNGHETADLSRGVLERFTRRARKNFYGNFTDSNGTTHVLGNIHLKNIVNPRYVKEPGGHYTEYFEGLYGVDERAKIVPPHGAGVLPIVADKIALNHYRCKSKEEFLNKVRRGFPTSYSIDEELFEPFDHNDEFDDGILKYRDERAKTYQPPDKSHADERLLNALTANLSPVLLPNTPPKFYAGKMETFLTCRAVAAYLKPKLADDTLAKSFEEAALKAILRSIGGMSFADARLFLRELPTLLKLPYPAAKEIRTAALQIIPQIMHILHLNNMWKDYVELDYLQEFLKE